VKKLYLLILFVSTIASFAQTGPVLTADSKIKIDGLPSDWTSSQMITKSFGKSKGKDGFVDVSLFHLTYTPSKFIFKAFVSPSVERYSPAGDEESILHISFDLDVDSKTGSSADFKYLILNPGSYAGYEYRYDLLKANGGIVGRLYSHKDDFKKPIKEWKNGDALLNGKKNNIEFALPYDLIDFAPDGKKKVKLRFVEIGNAQEIKDGTGAFSGKVLTLDFTKAVKEVEEVKEGEASESGFSIWHLILLTLWVVSILCSFAIAPKAGLSSGLAAINLLPFIGQVIFLFILAFGEWPLHKDFNKLENRIRDYEEQASYDDEY
jgi:hypothetical protein